MASPSATINRSTFPELLVKGINVKFDDTLKARTDDERILSKIFTIQGSDQAVETVASMSGFGMFEKKPEGARIRFDLPERGRAAKWIHKTFAHGFAITEEMVEDEKVGAMAKWTAGLVNAGMNTRTYWALLVLALGFGDSKTLAVQWGGGTDDFSLTGSVYVGADGQPLFSTAHPISGTAQTINGHPLKGTYSNKLTAAMTETSIGTAVGLLDTTPDEKGQIAKKHARVVVYPAQLRLKAQQILRSAATIAANYSSGVKNLIADENLEGVCAEDLPDANDWYVAAAPTETTLTIFDRVKFGAPKQEDDFQTGNHLVKTRARWSAGYSDPRGIVGSIVPTGQ